MFFLHQKYLFFLVNFFMELRSAPILHKRKLFLAGINLQNFFYVPGTWKYLIRFSSRFVRLSQIQVCKTPALAFH